MTSKAYVLSLRNALGKAHLKDAAPIVPPSLWA